MSPKLRELLKRAILNPGEAVEITGEEEKELLELTAFLEQHPQITPSSGEVNSYQTVCVPAGSKDSAVAPNKLSFTCPRARWPFS